VSSPGTDRCVRVSSVRANGRRGGLYRMGDRVAQSGPRTTGRVHSLVGADRQRRVGSLAGLMFTVSVGRSSDNSRFIIIIIIIIRIRIIMCYSLCQMIGISSFSMCSCPQSFYWIREWVPNGYERCCFSCCCWMELGFLLLADFQIPKAFLFLNRS